MCEKGSSPGSWLFSKRVPTLIEQEVCIICYIYIHCSLYIVVDKILLCLNPPDLTCSFVT